MMKRFFTSFILSSLSFSTMVAQTPITLTNADMPANLDTLRFSNAQLSSLGNYTVTGTNYNWDFTTLVPSSQGLRSFINPGNTPYFIFFLGFNGSAEKIADTLLNLPGIVSITDFYQFYKKSTANPNAYLADGVGLSISSLPVPSYYEDKDEVYNFPLSYLRFDSTSFRFSTPNTTLIPIGYSSTGKRATRVDGWGTISTPFGTAPCLRVVSNVYANDTLKNTFFPIPFRNNTRSYQWLTNVPVNGKNVRIPMLEISGTVTNGLFTPTQVRYRDVYRDPLAIGLTEQENLPSIAFYPNPASEQLYFKNDVRLQGVQLTISNVLGKAVYEKTLHVEPSLSISSISVANLKPGVYVVSLQKNNQRTTFKLLKN